MDIEQALCDRQRYRAVFAKLRGKARREPHRLRSHPVVKAFPLDWVLRSEAVVTQYLIGHLKKHSYLPGEASQNLVSLDKKRLIYSLSWPDRICEAVLAGIVGEIIEPQLSPHLFSFRRGFSNLHAVHAAANFVARESKGGPLYLLRRDIASYGESIDQSMLSAKLRDFLGTQSQYSWELLEGFLAPRYRSSSGEPGVRLSMGIPAGFALTPVCENLYLSQLDERASEIPGMLYCRFGDDILAAHSDPQRISLFEEDMQRIVEGLQLRMKEDKRRNLLLSGSVARDAAMPAFHPAPAVDYLGFRINASGKVFLSQSNTLKFKGDLRRIVRYAFHANRPLARDRSSLVQALINAVNLFFEHDLEQRHIPILLKAITDLPELKKLDRWVAKLTLRYCFNTGHDRVFKFMSYSELRSRGLVSLVHLRNVALRRGASVCVGEGRQDIGEAV